MFLVVPCYIPHGIWDHVSNSVPSSCACVIRQGTWIIWLVSISISSEFDFFSIEVWDLAHRVEAGGEHTFTNQARTRNPHRWKKSINSRDLRLYCWFVQMVIDVGIVQHAGGRKSKYRYFIPHTGIRWVSLNTSESLNLLFWISIFPIPFLFLPETSFRPLEFLFLVQTVKLSLKVQACGHIKSSNVHVFMEEKELNYITAETKH